MGQAKQRGTYEQRRALAIALIEENTRVAAIEVKKLQAETEPRILMVEGGHNARMFMTMAAALASTENISPLLVESKKPYVRRRKGRSGL